MRGIILNSLKEKFNLTEKEMLYLPSLQDVPLESLEEKISVYITFFGSKKKFFKFVEAQEIVSDWGGGSEYRKNNIFVINPQVVEARLEWQTEFFNVSTEKVKECWLCAPSWAFHNAGYFESRVLAVSNYFSITLDEAKKLCLKKTWILGKQWTRVENRVLKYADYFRVDRTEIMKLILEFPEFIDWPTSKVIDNHVPSIVLQNPILLECMSDFLNNPYVGYWYFGFFWGVIDYIQKKHGNIERVITKRYRSEGELKILFVRNKDKTPRLITLGYGYVTERERRLSWTQEDRLLMSILGEKMVWEPDHSELIVDLPNEKTETISLLCDCIYLSSLTSYVKNFSWDMTKKTKTDSWIATAYAANVSTQSVFVQKIDAMMPHGEKDSISITFKSLNVDYPEGIFGGDLSCASTICFELKYCKDESTDKERRKKNFFYWGSDSLFCSSNEETSFYERYFAPIQEQYKDKVWSNSRQMKLYKERFESQKVFYYTREQTTSIIESIKKDQPENSQVVIGWLEKATTEYNGFYLIGV